MSDYDNNMRGVLFKNKDKRDDRDPDYRGRIEVEKTEYWLSAWINESKKDGTKYMSLRVNPKEQQQNGAGSGNQPKTTEIDDEIPF